MPRCGKKMPHRGRRMPHCGKKIRAAAYRSRLADADRRFGRLLDSLRRSGRYDEAIVVVLADHGEAFAAGGAVPPGRDLGRASVEVPLAIRVPEALRPRLAAPAGATVGLDRVRATILELAGLHPAPALAPSLLRPAPWVALSELWLANGYHEVGALRGRPSAPLALPLRARRSRSSTPPGAKRWAPTAGSPTAT